ncbi:MAG: DUF3006 domain-containing protein [Halanaerobiaceae bacterium]|nr:DUF3006 domain-containing protein [Halanaerobiaceae bacterium]
MLIIDRFEGKLAIIEAGEIMIELPRKYLPDFAREGDVLKIEIDEERTKKRKEKIKKMADNLFE